MPMLADILGGWELVLIIAVVLILYGAQYLPGIARGLRLGFFHFRKALDQEAHDAGESLGGIHGKPATEALTPDNQTAELYDPAVFHRGPVSEGLTKIKRSYIIAAFIVLVLGVAWLKGFWFTEVFHTRKSNEPHRAALLQIRDAVSVGASHAEVLAVYWQHRTDSLRLFADRPADWIITMPQELGASDLNLLIERFESALRTDHHRAMDRKTNRRTQLTGGNLTYETSILITGQRAGRVGAKCIGIG